MSQEANVQTIRSLIEEIRRGDIASAMARYVEDAEMFLSGPRKKRPAHVKGRTEMFKVLGESSKEGKMQMELLSLAANEHQAFSLLRVRAEKGSRTLDTQMIIVWRFREGRICEMREFYWDAAGLVDFWES